MKLSEIQEKVLRAIDEGRFRHSVFGRMESATWIDDCGEILIVRETTTNRLCKLGYIEWVYGVESLHHSMPHITKLGKEYLRSCHGI